MSNLFGSTPSDYIGLSNLYFGNLGTVPQDAYRIDQFFRALTAAGLNTYLVDGCFCRTTQNLTSGTDLKTINGVSATLGGTPTIGADGLTTNGTSQYAYWAVTDTTANSIAVTAKGCISGQTSGAAFWALQNSLGIGTSSTMGGESLLFNGTGNAYVFTIQTASAATTNSIVDPTSSSAHDLNYYNPYELHTVITNDNASSPTLNGYVNGKLCMTDSSGNRQTTVARNRFVLGARIYEAGVGGVQNYFRGTFKHWFLFNIVLSATQVRALEDACRWLNPAKKNLLYLGDSTSTFLYTKPADAWSYQHSILQNQSDKKVNVVAINGQSASYFDTNYDNLVGRYKPNANGVDEAWINVWLGINDINGGSTDAQTYTSLKSIWAKCKRDGFKVNAMTLMPGTGYDVTKEGYRNALNTSILGDPTLYDSVFRPDLFFPDRNDTTIYLDTFHLLTEANRQLANAVNDGWRDNNIRPYTYPLTDAASIVVDCSLIPERALCTVTLAGNRTLANWTNPTHGREVTFRFLQDGTGSRTLTLDTNYNVGPFTFTLTTTINKADYATFRYNAIAGKAELINFTKGY